MNSYEYWRNQIEKCAETNSFPELAIDKYLESDREYPLWYFADYTVYYNKQVPIDKIHGSNWSFQTKEKRSGYPKERKLRDLLRGYMENADIPAVDIYLIKGKYFLEEGNHRLYLSRLLGRETILANIWEYHYDDLLRDSIIYREEETGGTIEYKEKLYDLDEGDFQTFKRRKNEVS